MLDLQARLDSITSQQHPEASSTQPPSMPWDGDKTLDVPATDSGVWNAVVIWFEVWPLHACKSGYNSD